MNRRPFFILAPFDFASGYQQQAFCTILSFAKAHAYFRIDNRCKVVEENCVNFGFRQLEAQSFPSDWKLLIYPVSQLAEKGENALEVFERHRELGTPEALTPQAEIQYKRLKAGADRSYDITVDKRTIVFTAWEVAYLQPEWVEKLNQAALVIVPSRFCLEVFKACGVTVPMRKIPLGVDQNVYRADVDPRHGITGEVEYASPGGLLPGRLTYKSPNSWPALTTFGTASGAATFTDGKIVGGGIRKNVNQVLEIFHKAFPNEDDVRLKIKVPPYDDYDVLNDPRVEVCKERLTDIQMADWYRSLSCYVNCSHGEGFGLHMLEAMACGRPLLSMDYSGVTEFFDAEVGYVGAFNLEEIPAGPWMPYKGIWPRPDTDSFVKLFRQIYQSDGGLLRNKGKLSAERAKVFTWDRMAEKLLWEIRKLMR